MIWHLLPLGLLEKRVQSRAPETRKNLIILIIGHAQHYSSKFRTRYHGVDSCRCRHCVARVTIHDSRGAVKETRTVIDDFHKLFIE